ncbi:MAG: hypothetical protein K2X82_03750 [Gemmataceae bacterium]|nr:hypothetical protein [Gemmataceae bacterium]
MVYSPPQTCGLHSLYVAARVAGYPFPGVNDLHAAAAPLDDRGVSAERLVGIAAAAGVPVDGVRTDLAALCRWGRPAILHVNGNHFVTLVGRDRDRLVVFDNNVGLFVCTEAYFGRAYRWDGAALLVGGRPPFWQELAGRPAAPIAASALAFGGALVVVPLLVRRRSRPGGSATCRGTPSGTPAAGST